MNRTAKLTIAMVDWPLLVMGSLAIWLGGSLVVDLLVVPSLSATGMIAEPGFIRAGHLLFSIFNHVEMLLAGLVLSGCFFLHQEGFFSRHGQRFSRIFALVLLAIAIIYTYALTPAITDLGFDMASFTSTGEMPGAMMPLHWLYWSLELVKLSLGVTLVRWCYHGVMAE